MTITATWIPGFERNAAPAGDAGPYTGGPVKLVWHTSETQPGTIDAVANALKVKQHTDVYHVLCDPAAQRIVQVLPLNVAASALAHPPSVETNHDGAIQVCIIGHAHDAPALSQVALAWLGSAVLAPIARAVPDLSINNLATFYGDDAGFTLASANARQRFAPSTWDNFGGQCGHQHVPGNDHWDPGKLNVAAITAAAKRALGLKGGPSPAPQPPHAAQQHRVLRQGDTGADVLELQRKMRYACNQIIMLDGAFGPKTRGAVVNIQTFFKLQVDGIAGPQTWGMVDYCAALKGVQ